MTALLRFDGVCLAFGDQVILNQANLRIETGERLCLIGRNGAGKSSTLKLLTGQLEPDEGKIESPASVSIAMLDQVLSEGSPRRVREVVADGMAEQTARIAAFRELSAEPHPNSAKLRELEALEAAIESGGGWSVEVQVESIMTQMELPAEDRMSELSGGWRRRVALAQVLVSQPDLLLLDEPTNHLDITTIEWLEREVRRFNGAALFVTHDRGFVERLATRIIEIDRGSSGAGRAATRIIYAESTKPTRTRIVRTPSSTRSWQRKKPGYARGSKPGRAAMKGGFGRWKKCATSGQCALSALAMPASISTSPSNSPAERSSRRAISLTVTATVSS